MPTGSVTPAAAFNGGTITKELVVDTGSATTQALELQGTRTVGADPVFRIDYPFTVLDIDSDGTLQLSSSDAANIALFGTGTASANLSVADALTNSVNASVSSYFGFTLTQRGTGNPNLTIADKDGNYVFAAGTSFGGGIRTSPQLIGALPTTTFVSGTGKQIDTTQDRNLIVPVTFNPTAGAAATCAVALSPDNTTYSALGTETEPAGVALDGTIHLIRVYAPALWYVKLTATNATIGTGTYY